MRGFGQFYNDLFLYARRLRRSRPEDIPKKLAAEALENALAEARFLFGNGVDVRSLAAGEKPESPRAADGNEPPFPSAIAKES